MSARLKEAQENITLAMLPDSDFSEEERTQLTAWAALRAIHRGMEVERVCYLYRVTLEQIAPYREEWERNRLEWERVQALEQAREMVPA